MKAFKEELTFERATKRTLVYGNEHSQFCTKVYFEKVGVGEEPAQAVTMQITPVNNGSKKK